MLGTFVRQHVLSRFKNFNAAESAEQSVVHDLAHEPILDSTPSFDVARQESARQEDAQQSRSPLRSPRLASPQSDASQRGDSISAFARQGSTNLEFSSSDDDRREPFLHGEPPLQQRLF